VRLPRGGTKWPCLGSILRFLTALGIRGHLNSSSRSPTDCLWCQLMCLGTRKHHLFLKRRYITRAERSFLLSTLYISKESPEAQRINASIFRRKNIEKSKIIMISGKQILWSYRNGNNILMLQNVIKTFLSVFSFKINVSIVLLMQYSHIHNFDHILCFIYIYIYISFFYIF